MQWELILGLGRLLADAGTLMSRLTETDCSLAAEFVSRKQQPFTRGGGYIIPTSLKLTIFSDQGSTIEHDMWLKTGGEH